MWLHEHEGCELQLGGSDQWGNITAGIDLIRRREGDRVHGLTWPLLLRSDGRKFGKSDGAENVWLSPALTSPYAFYQYWIQVPDADVERFLLQLTLLPVDECRAVAAAHLAEPGRREGQRRLAREVTTLVHGPAAAEAAEAASAALFGADLETLPPGTLAGLEGEVDTTLVDGERLGAGVDVVELLVETGLARGAKDARRLLAQGGVYLNNRRVEEGRVVGADDLRDGRHLLLRSGKRSYHLVAVGGTPVPPR